MFIGLEALLLIIAIPTAIPYWISMIVIEIITMRKNYTRKNLSIVNFFFYTPLLIYIVAPYILVMYSKSNMDPLAQVLGLYYSFGILIIITSFIPIIINIINHNSFKKKVLEQEKQEETSKEQEKNTN